MNKKQSNMGFTKVPNAILWNKRLRLEEKALLAILMSNAEHWNIYITEIYSRSENSEGSQRATLKALIKKGFASQTKYSDPDTKQIKWKTKPFPEGNANAQTKPSFDFPEMETGIVDLPNMDISNMDFPITETDKINNSNGNNTYGDTNKEEDKKEIEERNKKETNKLGDSLGIKEENHIMDLKDGRDPIFDSDCPF